MTNHMLRFALSLMIAASVACSDKQGAEDKGSAPQAIQAIESSVQAIEPLSIDDEDLSPTEPNAEQAQAGAISLAPTLNAAVDEEIDAIARHLGGNPNSIREYVAQEIAHEPYTGVLRGAKGTFLAKAGNSADRALLLAALLRAGDDPPKIRFASCDAVELQVPVVRRRAMDESDFTRAKARATDSALSSGIRWYEEALSRARYEARQSELLLTAALEPVLKPVLASLARGATTENGHIWLQLNRGGTWVDMDPATNSGAPPCSATGTQAEVSPELFHRVTLSVVAETLKGGTLSESVLLRVERRTAELAASRILFTFGEPSGLVEPGDDKGDGLALYTPVLRIDGESLLGTPLALPRISPKGGPQDISGGFSDVLGGDFYGGAEQSQVPDEEIMSAWIQVDMTAPGGSDISARSEIFDRLGMAIRLKGSDSGFGLNPLAEVDGEYAATSSFWEVGLIFGELEASETMLNASIDVSTVDGLSAILDGVARTFPTVRRELGGGPSSPVVLMVGVIPTEDTSGQAGSRVVFDALHVESGIPDDARRASRDAIATPFAEYLLASSVGSLGDELDDVVHVMRSAAASSIPLVTLDATHSRTIEGASATASSRIDSRVGRGQVLFTPARAPATSLGVTKTAWWYLDPATGAVGDEHENGRHAAQVEYKAPQMKKPSLMARVKKYACYVAIPFFVATSTVNFAKPSPETAKIVKAFKSGGGDSERRRKLREALKVACDTKTKIRNTPPGPSP